jgi:protein TonB
MEPKKNPAYDVHRYSKATFLFSLGITLALVIIAFEWETEFTKITIDPQPPQEATFVAYSVPITVIDPTVKKTPQPISKPVNPHNIVEVPDQVTDGIDVPAIDVLPDTASTIAIAVPDIPVEKTDEPVVFAEKMPEPDGGYAGFYKFLKKNMKYPAVARRMNLSGKVFVQFVVNENGTPSDVQVIRGIGGGCDEEAARVIAMSKWKPGKQRGKAVRVRMVQPIDFVLQHP